MCMMRGGKPPLFCTFFRAFSSYYRNCQNGLTVLNRLGYPILDWRFLIQENESDYRSWRKEPMEIAQEKEKNIQGGQDERSSI